MIIRGLLVVCGVLVFVSLFSAIFWLAVLCDLGDIENNQVDQPTDCSICDVEEGEKR